MRWRALLSLLALLWIFVLVGVAVGWGPFAGSSLPPMFSAFPAREVPAWIGRERLPQQAVPGAKLFAIVGCTGCHTYAGFGRSNFGAPDLTAIGSRQRGVAFFVRHLKCPSCVHPRSPMPPFASLGRQRLMQLAIFLEASKGTH
jgi:mono/diheme cytochrome c family protein